MAITFVECERELKMSDLCDKTAVELRRLIGRKDISPVELSGELHNADRSH